MALAGPVTPVTPVAPNAPVPPVGPIGPGGPDGGKGQSAIKGKASRSLAKNIFPIQAYI